MEIKKWVDNELGQYPHNHLNIHSIPKQGTRLLKAYCPQSNGEKGDYKVRITQGVADIAVPICGCCEGLYQDALKEAIQEVIDNDERVDSIDFDDIAEPFRLILE